MIRSEYKHSVELLENALSRLIEAVEVDITTNSLAVDAAIQRFEFTFELFWKALKKVLFYDYGIDLQSPKTVLQGAYSNKLIVNERVWLEMLNDRNLTSHTYNQKLALEIYHRIQQYAPFLQQEFTTVWTR